MISEHKAGSATDRSGPVAVDLVREVNLDSKANTSQGKQSVVLDLHPAPPGVFASPVNLTRVGPWEL